MMFEISRAKHTILEQLAEQDWAPTDLAEELDTSPETIYNHLNDLETDGVLTTRKEPAKTRPKTVYSIDDGLIHYIAVLPGQLTERALKLDRSKQALVRIWSIPQPKFHPYLEEFWYQIRARQDVIAAGVYGSVARGDADEDSDIDLLLIAADEDAKQELEDEFGAVRLTAPDGSTKLGMTEVYTKRSTGTAGFTGASSSKIFKTNSS